MKIHRQFIKVPSIITRSISTKIGMRHPLMNDLLVCINEGLFKSQKETHVNVSFNQCDVIIIALCKIVYWLELFLRRAIWSVGILFMISQKQPCLLLWSKMFSTGTIPNRATCHWTEPSLVGCWRSHLIRHSYVAKERRTLNFQSRVWEWCVKEGRGLSATLTNTQTILEEW